MEQKSRKSNAKKIITYMVMISLILLSMIGCGSDELAMSGGRGKAPGFSAEGGFYDAPFTLELSSGWGGTVYYTTDGSDPRTSDTAKEYTDGIRIYDNTDEPNVYSAVRGISLLGYNPPQYNIDKGIVIRAVVKGKNDVFGPVVAQSYFVGKEDSYYYDMRVISMVTDSDNLFDKDKGAYKIGSKYYEWKNSDAYEELDGGDVNNVTNYNSDGKESEIPVSVQVFENGESVYSADVGARIAGNWSRARAQKSFRFYARKEYGSGKMKYAFFDELVDVDNKPIESFDKVTLRNSGNDFTELHIRDALYHELTEDLSIETMASEPCILFINGEFWGFYMIREKVDSDYIESHYDIPKEAVVVIKNNEIDEGTSEDLKEYRQFCEWAASADMSKEENYKKFCETMDVQSLMDYMAVETYINNNDWANGYFNNWIVWRTNDVWTNVPKADGKWRFVLYDTEFSSGLYNMEETHFKYDRLKHMYVEDKGFDIPGVVRNLCKNEEFCGQFYDNYLHVMETCFEPDDVMEKIDEYVETYGEAIEETNKRFDLEWANFNYEGEVNELKDFFRNRPEYAKKYLDKFCKVK